MTELFSITNILLFAIGVGIWFVWRALVDIFASLGRIEERMGTRLFRE